ncbi:MAG: hypothetical protein ACRCV0_03270 [Brevinema sp.]
MSLQLIFRYTKDLSPFDPYIGLYHIPKSYRAELEAIFISILDKYGYITKPLQNYIYSYVDFDKDHQKMLTELDKNITAFFSKNNITLN